VTLNNITKPFVNISTLTSSDNPHNKKENKIALLNAHIFILLPHKTNARHLLRILQQHIRNQMSSTGKLYELRTRPLLRHVQLDTTAAKET